MSFSSQNWSTRLGFCSRSVQFCIQSAPWHHLLHNSHSFRSPPSPASRVLSWLRVQSQRGKNSLHNESHKIVPFILRSILISQDPMLMIRKIIVHSILYWMQKHWKSVCLENLPYVNLEHLLAGNVGQWTHESDVSFPLGHLGHLQSRRSLQYSCAGKVCFSSLCQDRRKFARMEDDSAVSYNTIGR